MEFELMKEQLKGEYRQVFSEVLVYGSMKNISADMLTDRLTELYDILLTAQTEGRDVRRITGSDRERFCRDFFGDFTPLERLRELPGRFYSFAWVIFVMELLPFTADAGSNEKAVSNILPYLFGIGLGVVFELMCSLVILPLMFRNRKISPETWNNIAIVGFAAMFFGMLISQDSISAQLNVPSLPLVICSGAYIAIFFTVRSVWRYKHFGTIRNERKLMLKDSYYKNLSSVRLELIVMNGWKKQYERLSSRGKVTAEGYLDKLKSSEHINDIVDRGFDLFVAVIYLASVIGTAAASEGITDILVFALISGVISYFIWRFFSKAFRQGAGVRKKLISQCETAGKTMPEYLEDRLSQEDG